MKNKIIIINLFILAIIFIHCSKNNNNNILAKYNGGQLTQSELIARISKNKFDKVSVSKSFINTIQEYANKKIVFDHSDKLIDDKGVNNEIQRIANDQKLKQVLDNLLKNYTINDSIIDFIYSSELTKYTIQDIVITHRLSYSQHKDRSPKEAYEIAKHIRGRIETKQISFDEAVSIYAEHPSVELRKGIMGPLPYGKLPKEFNDLIWQSSPGDIVGTIETKIVYHVFKTLKKENEDASQIKNRKKAIKNEIKGGRYGYLDEYTDTQADKWFRLFGGEIYIENIDTLWQIADNIGLFEIPNGVSILRLNETGYTKPVAKINNQILNVDWFIKKAEEHGTFKKSRFVKGYFLYNTLKDLLHRHSSIMWFDKSNTIFNHQITDQSIKIKQENYLFETFMKQEMKKDSTLTNSVILNRLAIKYDLEINNDVINPN